MIEYNGTGGWIYTKHVLSWSDDRELVKQLPARLRYFCYYAKIYNRLIGTKTVLFAHTLYRMIGAHKLKHKPCKVLVRNSELWLDFGDPGALNAIKELRDGSPVSNEITSLCKDADLFIDIGANQGAMTIVASKELPKSSRILAIEPQPNLCECIELSLSAAMPQSAFDVLNVAVGNMPTTAILKVPDENFGEAHIEASNADLPEEKVTIKVTTLDFLLKNVNANNTVVVKMDIEGYELAALQGGREFFARCKPRLILEINIPAMARYNYTTNDLSKWLATFGYSYWRRCGDQKNIFTIDKLPEFYCDIVVYSDLSSP